MFHPWGNNNMEVNTVVIPSALRHIYKILSFCVQYVYYKRVGNVIGDKCLVLFTTKSSITKFL